MNLDNKTNYIFSVEEVLESTKEITTLSTGYKEIDFGINGINKGEVYVVASRPTKGKGCLINNIVYNIIINNHLKILYICLTESLDSFIKKLVSFDTNIPLQDIHFKELDSLTIEEKERINHSLIFLENKNLRLGTCNDLEKIKELVEEENPDIVFIDQFQNLKVPQDLEAGFNKNLHNQSTKIKEIASNFNIPVFVTSNISNKLEDKNIKDYNLFNIYEAGFNITDINSVIFCFKENEKMSLRVISAKGSDEFLFDYKVDITTFRIL